jgi:poly-gamma-glutamate synthase PgsB/CapB
VQTTSDTVDDAEMARFAYHEHEDNVALALGVCAHLGVSREVALRGMSTCRPDAGALTTRVLCRDGKELTLLNAMAANDPQSTEQLYRELVKTRDGGCLVVANARRDRPARTQQLAGLLTRLEAHHVFAVGDGARTLAEMALARNLPKESISCHAGSVEDLVTAVFNRTRSADGRAMVFAIGNIAGPGLALVDYFETHGHAVGRLEPLEHREKSHLELAA